MEGQDPLAEFDRLTRKTPSVADSVPATGGADPLAEFDRLTGAQTPATPDSTLHQQGDIVLPATPTPAPRRGRIATIASGINDFLSKDRAPAISAAVSRFTPDVTLENFRPIPRGPAATPPRIDERLLTQRPDASDVVTGPAMAADRSAATRRLNTGGYDRAKVEQAANIADATARDPDAPPERRQEAAAVANNLRQQMIAEDARGGPFQKAVNALALHGLNMGPDLTLRMAAERGLLATPEDLADLAIRDPSGEKRATQPGFSASDMAAEGVGQLPYFMLGGAAARGAAAIGLEALPELGLATDGKIAHALGRLADGMETTAQRGTLARTAERALRGGSQGAVVGPAVQYASERQSGASPDEAALGAALNTAFGATLGAGAEVAGGLVGDTGMARLFMFANDASRAVGSKSVIAAAARHAGDSEGFIREMQPYVARGRRMLDERALGGAAVHAEAAGVDAEMMRRTTAAAEAARVAEGKLPIGDKMPEAQAKTIATLLQQALDNKRVASGGILPEPPAREEPLIQVPESYGGSREARAVDNTQLPTAREAGLRNAGLQPHEEADATVQMARAADEAAAQQQALAAEANDPNVRLEQAAQARPGNVQGPRTLRETLADTPAQVEAGDPLATDYHAAINQYADALAAVQDAGEKGPNTRTQIALARARNALNDARTKYGKQFGASAVLALAANDDDLTDDEKKLVGLGGLAIGSTVVHDALGNEVATAIHNDLGTRFEPGHRMGPGAWLDEIDRAHDLRGEPYSVLHRGLLDRAAEAGGGELTRSQVQEVLRRDEINAAIANHPINAAPNVAPAEAPNGYGATVPAGLREEVRTDIEAVTHGHETLEPRDWVLRGRRVGLSDEQAQAWQLAMEDHPNYEGGLITQRDALDALDRISPDAPGTALVRPASTAVQGARIEPGKFVSRLRSAVEALPKKWDAPAPAGDWIGKLKGTNTFKREELAMILPALEDAQRSKVRLSRADVLSIVEDETPKIERVTLGEQQKPAVRAIEGGGDTDNIRDFDEIALDEEHPDELREQAQNRRARVTEIEQEIDQQTERAADEMQGAENRVAEYRRDIMRAAEEHWPNTSAESAIDAALGIIHENVEAEYIPRGTIDKAMNSLFESGDFSSPEEPTLPDGYTVEESDGGGYYIEDPSRRRITKDHPTELEAMAEAHADGSVDVGSADARILPRDYSIKEEDGEFVLYDGAGNWQSRARTREDAVRGYIMDNWSGADEDAGWQRMKDELTAYAEAYADYQRAESEHYWYAEGEAFGEERQEIDRLNDEAGQLDEAADTTDGRAAQGPALPAPEDAPNDAAENPFLMPIVPEVKGTAKYSSYQRIGGGTNYRELLNVWENNPGRSYEQNHYGNQGFANVVGHIRVEDHTVTETPDVSGERISYTPGEPEAVRLAKSKIDEVRQRRSEALKKMEDIVRRHEAMTPEEQTTAHDLAREYGEVNNDVLNLARREDDLLRELRLAQGANVEPERVAVMIESQSDWAQDAGKFGVATPPTAADLAEAAAMEPALQEAERQYNVATAAAMDANVAWSDGGAERIAAVDALARAVAEINNTAADNSERIFHRELLDSADEYQTNRANVLAAHPELAPLLERIDEETATLRAQFDERNRTREVAGEARDALDELRDRRDELTGANASDKVPPSPFIETQAAFALNAARFLIDSAERGYERIAWSDGANRVRNAHLPMQAARVVYDEITPSAVKRLLGGLGFKDVKPEKLFIRGNGHWSIRLTPEMREAIRKTGVPMLGVMALMAVPDDAEAQGTDKGGAKLYGTGVGLLTAAAALAALGASRKLRRLVHENRELNRALMVDDLTGLANQRAFRRAIETVDGDPHTAWVSFDADGFKRLNDVHGHPEGDKALAHFGDTIRAQAEALGVPMRGFRAGGDEFAFAVPQDQAAAFVGAVERASRYEKDGVTTKLSGSWGQTFADADAAVTATKALRRDTRTPEMIASPAVQGDDGRYYGPVEPGGSHLGASRKAVDAGNMKVNRALGSSRGFMTTHGRFVSRKEGLAIAERAGQVTPEQAAELRAFWKDFPESPHHGLGSEDIPPAKYGGLPNGVILYANPLGAALKELRRAPGAATVGIVGALATESDNEDIRKAGVPLMALGALSAIGAERIMRGGDAIGAKVVDVLGRSEDGKAAVRFFNPSALLSDEVKAAIQRFEEGRARGKARAVEYFQQSKALGPVGDRAVSDVLDSEGWEDVSGLSPDEHAKILAVGIANAAEYERLAAEKVAAGVLDPGSVIPNYGGARRYAFFEANQALGNTPRATAGAGATPRIGAQKARTLDIPIHEAERKVREAYLGGDPQVIRDAEDALGEARAVQLTQRVERGEIREQSHRIAYTLEKGYADVEAAKLFTALRNIPGTAHPEWVGAVDDIRTATTLLKQSATQADHDTAKAMLDEAKVRLADVQRQFKRKDAEWVTLPDSPGMGAMAGAVVQKDVANELEGFATRGGKYAKLLRFWKEAKTVFNPGTHAANIISNISFAHMEGLGIHEQPVYLTRAAKDMKRYGDATRALAERGILEQSAIRTTQEGAAQGVPRGVDALENLLPTTRPETADVLRREGISEQTIARKRSQARARGALGGLALGAALGADNEDNGSGATLGGALGAVAGAAMAGRAASFRNFYQSEDNIFRVAIYLKRRALGDTEEMAARYTRDALGNFRSRSPAMNMARQSIAPFLLYPAKAVPRFARKMIDHPIRYLSLVAAWAYINEQAKQDVGEVPESDIAIKDRRGLFGYFLPGFMQLPFTNERGERAATDMARWTALGSATTLAPPGSVPAAMSPHIPAVFNAGGPVVDLAARFGANVDSYTGKPAYKTDYPAGENISRLLNDAAETALPQVLGLHRERLTADAEAGDWDKFKNDLLGVAGAKPRYVRPGANIRGANYQLQESLAGMKHDFQTDLINNRREDRTPALVQRYNRRIASALTNYLERVGAPPPQALVDEYLDTRDASRRP